MKHKILGFFLTISIVACSSTSKNIFTNKIQEPSAETKILAPDWTTLTSGVYKDPSGKAVFYGLGSVNKEEMILDRKNLSEDRARDELTKVLTSYIERLAKEVLESNLNNSITDLNKDQLVSSLDEGVATILMETEIINYWSNPDNGKVYSMAKLDLSRLTDKLDSFESIPMADRSFLRESIFNTHVGMANEQTDQV
ncbi:MAG: hypothetical protein ACJZ44_05220 [Nitrospinales bacterium]